MKKVNKKASKSPLFPFLGELISPCLCYKQLIYRAFHSIYSKKRMINSFNEKYLTST